MYQRARLGTQLYGAALAAVLLMAGVLSFNILFVIASLGVALFAGRLFCGWICPMGLWTEQVVQKLSRGRSEPRILQSPRFRYLFLTFFLASLIAVRHFGLVSPALFPFIMMGTVFVLATLLGILYRGRTWCSGLCPWGTMGGLLSRFSRYRLSVTESCVGCQRCVRNCASPFALKSAISDRKMSKEASVISEECVRCHRCVDVCPKGALEYLPSPSNRRVKGRKAG